MSIASVDNCALAEFEGKITSVVYFQGCDLSCQFCQNPQLIDIEGGKISTSQLVELIRLDMVDAVSLSGGEPLFVLSLSGEEEIDGMIDFLECVNDSGRLINLDTNGFITHQKEEVYRRIGRFVDVISVDIKRYMISSINVTEKLDTDKMRFRMVVVPYEGAAYTCPDFIRYLYKVGIREITLIPNSLSGRGADMPETPIELMRVVKFAMEMKGIHAIIAEDEEKKTFQPTSNYKGDDYLGWGADFITK